MIVILLLLSLFSHVPLCATVWTAAHQAPLSMGFSRQEYWSGTEETRRERDTCTPMFIAALFIIARTWKQPRCTSADEWIRKLWYIYTMEYYSAIKKNTFESVLMRWMILESILQSEVSQKEKHQYSAKSLQSCPTLCDPIDGSPPGSPVPGILQARTLEWVAISFYNTVY